ncbi:MAG: formylglycine-generating enzyme family protein [Lentisphaeria bacterium]|nr:formylglycine-generating enzyme family protein [Lentisphaeria bacterium]
MKRRILLLLCLLGGMAALHAEVKVKNVAVKPRWPWNGLVDITYSIECDEKDEDGKPKDVYVDFTGIDNDRNMAVKIKSLTGDGAKEPVKHGGPYTVTWDMAKDAPALNSADFQVEIHAIAGGAPYLVINLETWKKRYTSQPPNLDDDTCRTTELWLRQIPAGTFTMGCDSSEVGYYGYEFAKHQVTITQMFYIGVFECTQRQWELVMGGNPSYYKGDCRPVEYVSYNAIRGTGAQAGAGWPVYGHAVDASSFMGRLQEKTGLTFDLPTEAQWEYACRAGTTTALNSGKNLTSTSSDANMNEVGRYYYNQSEGKGGYTSEHTKVGSYLPNAWGLYDMHGNVYEWCLDWWGANTSSTAAETDPVGPNTGSYRVERGGYWLSNAQHCRSAYRVADNPSYSDYVIGFRVLCLPLGR